jgi:hypothetical protein
MVMSDSETGKSDTFKIPWRSMVAGSIVLVCVGCTLLMLDVEEQGLAAEEHGAVSTVEFEKMRKELKTLRSITPTKQAKHPTGDASTVAHLHLELEHAKSTIEELKAVRQGSKSLKLKENKELSKAKILIKELQKTKGQSGASGAQKEVAKLKQELTDAKTTVGELKVELNVVRNSKTVASATGSGWKQKIVLMAVYFGKVEKSSFLSYTLGSMGTNAKNVQFVIVNVLEHTKDAEHLKTMAGELAPHNLKILPMSISEWGLRVKTKLSIDVPWDPTWYYKVNDYKPAFGVLFDDIFQGADWWGWIDLDVIFGERLHQ